MRTWGSTSRMGSGFRRPCSSGDGRRRTRTADPIQLRRCPVRPSRPVRRRDASERSAKVGGTGSRLRRDACPGRWRRRRAEESESGRSAGGRPGQASARSAEPVPSSAGSASTTYNHPLGPQAQPTIIRSVREHNLQSSAGSASTTYHGSPQARILEDDYGEPTPTQYPSRPSIRERNPRSTDSAVAHASASPQVGATTVISPAPTTASPRRESMMCE